MKRTLGVHALLARPAGGSAAAMRASMLVGLLFSLGSTALSNIGILFQKLSADTEAHKPLCQRWKLWMGMFLILGSELGLTTVALALAPLSVIAPLGGLAVVFNALLARFGIVVHKEMMSVRDWLSTLCILVGVTLVAITGPGTAPDDATADLKVTIPWRAPVVHSLWHYCACVEYVHRWQTFRQPLRSPSCSRTLPSPSLWLVHGCLCGSRSA